MLQLQQGPVLDHTKPGPQVTWLGLYETEAEGARVVISNNLEGKVQIPLCSSCLSHPPLQKEAYQPSQFLGLL